MLPWVISKGPSWVPPSPLTLPPCLCRELKKEKERQELWKQLDELQLKKLQGLEEAQMNRLNLQHSLGLQGGNKS